MRARIVLLLSLALNFGLAATLVYVWRHFSPSALSEQSSATAPVVTVPGPVRTNVVVRRQFFTWQEIESSDYRTFIDNLRSIGCPEDTIRDIIVAEINSLYERRRATEIVTPEQQWWRSVPDPEVIQAAREQWEALDTERRALLAELLGPNWEVVNSSQVHGFNIPLDGPILGNLSFEVKQALAVIENESAKARQEYQEALAKSEDPPDPLELARIQQETREQLAQVLTPEQLEEYLLRYSSNAHALRQELLGFNTTPEEFRKLFRARDAIDMELQLLSASDPAQAARREELLRRREEVTRESLGAERYTFYQQLQDPLFRQAQATALQTGAPPEAVLPFYQINRLTEQERARIQADETLTPEQRAAALEMVLIQQQESLRKILGDAAYERYQESIQQ